MSDYKFSLSQRYALYKVYAGVCQWCKQPVEFRVMHIDHVLPEALLKNPTKLASVLKDYGLPVDFNINDYENWIPAHSYCNTQKSADIYTPAPVILTMLKDCLQEKNKAQKLQSKLEQDQIKVDAFVKIQKILETYSLTLSQIDQFILQDDPMEGNYDDFEEIGKKIQETAKIQIADFEKQYGDLLKQYTLKELEKICKALGSNWMIVPHQGMITLGANESENTVRYFLRSKLTDAVDARIIVNPLIVDSKLIIEFKQNDKVFDALEFPLGGSIDWDLYKSRLAEHYKNILRSIYD